MGEAVREMVLMGRDREKKADGRADEAEGDAVVRF